jgi:hypothetical protein
MGNKENSCLDCQNACIDYRNPEFVTCAVNPSIASAFNIALQQVGAYEEYEDEFSSLMPHSCADLEPGTSKIYNHNSHMGDLVQNYYF